MLAHNSIAFFIVPYSFNSCSKTKRADTRQPSYILHLTSRRLSLQLCLVHGGVQTCQLIHLAELLCAVGDPRGPANPSTFVLGFFMPTFLIFNVICDMAKSFYL